MVKIHVTKENIEQGKVGQCRDCPIALAVNALLNPRYFAQVEEYVVDICDRDYHECTVCEVDLPPQARAFIHDFDRYNKPDPVSFRLGIPKEFLKTNV